MVMLFTDRKSDNHMWFSTMAPGDGDESTIKWVGEWAQESICKWFLKGVSTSNYG